MDGFRAGVWVGALTLAAASFCSANAQDAGNLAQEAQNPIANLISVPFQKNTNFNVGRLDNDQNILNIQPVIPFKAERGLESGHAVDHAGGISTAAVSRRRHGFWPRRFQSELLLRQPGQPEAHDRRRPHLSPALPYRMSLHETLDIGEDTGIPVSEDYKVPFKFTGDLEKVTINITEEDLEKYRQGRVKSAIAQ